MALKQLGDRWYGIYVLGKKVGWQLDSWKKKGEEICVVSSFNLKIAFLGTSTEMQVDEEACYSTKPPRGLVALASKRYEDGRLITITGGIKDKNLEFVVDTQSNKRTLTVPADSDSLDNTLPWGGVARMKPGDTVKSYILDELTGERKWQKITLKSSETRQIMGKDQTLHKIVVEDETQMKLDTLVNQDGTILEGTLGPSIRIVLEDEATAKRMDVGLLDLYSSSVIPAKGALSQSKVLDIRRLKVRLTGQESLAIPETPRQKVVDKGDNYVIIEVFACPQKVSGKTAEPEPRHTACNADIPCDTPDIVTLAKEITGKTGGQTRNGAEDNAPGPLARARTLTSWVNANFQYVLGGGGGTGDQILKSRRGECTEFAKALIVLARAAGIPARAITGIVPADYMPMSFGYHAWVEVFDKDKGWIAVDPTWGAFPVDAAHIIFDVDDGLAMASHLGGLNIEIIEVDYTEERGGLKCD